MIQGTKRRKPKKTHPWIKNNYFFSKPKELTDLLGYIAESDRSRKQRSLVHNKGEYK